MDGDLRNLNSVVLPEPAGWLPLAPGWKVLAVICLLSAIVIAWRTWLRWRANRYRREALGELKTLTRPEALPVLLKRAALTAYPRSSVASLHGEAWHRFLDRSAAMEVFEQHQGPLLEALTYGNPSPTETQLRELRAAVAQWLRRHDRAA